MLPRKKAIEAGPSPVLVIAGPGTGKNSNFDGAHRFICLNAELGHGGFLALTFTRKAAQEMNERMKAMLGEDEVLPRADTIHALAFDYWASMF